MRNAIDTAPRTYLSTIKVADHAAANAKRPAHALNDRLVTLNEGATGKALYASGANILGGRGLRGYVWAVDPNGRAIVDFGQTTSGHGLRAVCNVADLTEVQS